MWFICYIHSEDVPHSPWFILKEWLSNTEAKSFTYRVCSGTYHLLFLVESTVDPFWVTELSNLQWTHPSLVNVPSMRELMVSFHIPLSIGFTPPCPLQLLQARLFSSPPKLVIGPCGFREGSLSHSALLCHPAPLVLTPVQTQPLLLTVIQASLPEKPYHLHLGNASQTLMKTPHRNTWVAQ